MQHMGGFLRVLGLAGLAGPHGRWACSRLALRLCAGLGLCWCLLCWQPLVWAATEAPLVPDGPAQSVRKIEAAAASLGEVRQALDDAESLDSLKSLVEKASAAQRDADAAVAALTPQLAQIEARVAQLGPEDKASENAEIAAQRKALAKERSEVDSAVKQGKLLSVEASQAAGQIEAMRNRQFSAQIFRKVASPLTPAFWRELAAQAPTDAHRLRSLMRQGQAAFDQALAGPDRRHIGWGGLLALLLLLPVRLGLRHVGRRYAASDHAPDGRLRRSGLALWLLVVGTALPTLAAWVWVQALLEADAIAPRLQGVALQGVLAVGMAAFVASLSAALLAPKRPSWRLLNIDDQAAARLRKYAWAAAGVVAFSVVVRAISGAARTSEISSTALDGLAALSYVGLILAALWTLSRLRQRRQTQALAASEAAQRDAVARSGWLMLAWFGGHVAVLVALVAALWGYINFALFAASQMVWMTVVIMATLLLLKFVGDWASWLLSPVSRSGKALMQATDLSASRLEQGGVLLSALLRVAVMLLSVGAITAPYGNVDALFSWVDVFTQGVTIGGAVLKPGAVLWALVVLAIGLTVFNTFQRWLVETYLPKTELDIGARNSISTVARYAGICLTALWALAALGLGFEKLALVASALSVGIGFGLQAITQNFVSGLILLAERPVKLGDRIYIGDQIGDVRRINVRATEVQLDDKSTLIVPNSELITKPVRNLTMGTPLGRIQIKFTMPASTDVVALKGLLLSVYNAHELVLESPAPAVYIDGISDGAITLNSFAHVGSPRSVYAVRSELLFAVIACLAQEKLPLVTPADIHVIVDPQPDPATQAQPVPPTPQVGPVQAAPGGAR